MKTTLSQISAISLGTQLNRNTLSKSGDYPVFNGGMSESGYTSKSNTVANTLIISQGGESAGYVNYITVPFWAGAHCYIVQPTTGDVDKRYLYYYLKAMQPELQYSKSGSSIPGLSKSRLSEFPVYIPDMSQQLRVAHILSALDDKIELNDKINKKLNELARLIYDYWFVQFDFPDEDGHPYRVSGGKMVYNDLLKREIPEGWKAVKMSNIARITSGYPFKSDIYTASGKYRIITIKNVKDGFIDSSNCDHIILLPDNLPYECRLQIGDILLSLTGNVGRTGRVFEDNLLLNQRVGKVVCEDETNKAYIYMILTSEAIKKSLEQLSNGSSQANLSPIQATKFAIPLPPRDIIDKFNSSIKPILEMDIINRRESQQLAQLRDWLLPMLMSGQVVVK